MNCNCSRTRNLLSLLSGLMLYACFYPLNLGLVLGWVALVPLLIAVLNSETRRQAILTSLFAGLAFYVPVLQWMRVAHPAMYATWLGLALYCTFYLIVVMLLTRSLVRKGLPLWFVLPMIWTLGEYIRSHFPTGFSFLESIGFRTHVGFGWYHLGYSQRDNFLFSQLAKYTGIYGLTWVLVLVNCVLALWIQRYLSASSKMVYSNRRSLILATVGALLVVIGVHFSAINDGINDAVSLKSTLSHELKVKLIQTNIPQDIKNARGDEMLHQFLSLGDAAARERPDLIIWPETTCPDEWLDAETPSKRASLPVEFSKRQAMLREYLTNRFHSNILVGLNGLVYESKEVEWKYNSALFLNEDGTRDQRYDKMHLVPFGEYVPLRQTFPWMKMFTPYDHDYSCKPGETWTRFDLKKEDRDFHFGVMICYEDSDASMAREAVSRSIDAGEPLDFLVNISNDGWFNGTSEHEEHLSICRFRAIETRRPVVRAVNMGISAVIDEFGVVKKLPGDNYSSSKKVQAIVSDTLKLYDTATDKTIYVRFGDWVPGICFLCLFGCLIWSRVRAKAV
ncbi:apolipoprotein N-acyltransferase [Telmatocola sphagniphila]|uniref:Apolipoprotein N-acyltransferase n=1 Tax=Telmatocola sphagniphila TaxID=1123043 RepID=A0A8E6EW07_9BACT|nr:apolipoprotein N-acyltransferase [Telmatocola sphagniphila]QVL33307.1 apolipoprotein N-acyltransferase [Telmatocola sphagniphila]